MNLLGIRALPNSQLGGSNFGGYTNLAVLRYLGALRARVPSPPADPSQSVPTIQNPLIETNLHVS